MCVPFKRHGHSVIGSLKYEILNVVDPTERAKKALPSNNFNLRTKEAIHLCVHWV